MYCVLLGTSISILRKARFQSVVHGREMPTRCDADKACKRLQVEQCKSFIAKCQVGQECQAKGFQLSRSCLSLWVPTIHGGGMLCTQSFGRSDLSGNGCAAGGMECLPGRSRFCLHFRSQGSRAFSEVAPITPIPRDGLSEIHII